jgi:hypothetical protein
MASTLKARTRSFGVLSRRMGTAFVEQPGDSGEAERCSGIGLKLFGFIPGTGVHLHTGILFGIIPECRSQSSRNRVHLTPDSPTTVIILLKVSPLDSRGQPGTRSQLDPKLLGPSALRLILSI